MKRSQRNSRLDRGRRSPSIYSRTENQKNTFSLGGIFYFFLFLLLLALTYMIFLSPLFKITNVQINGQKFTNEGEIQSRVERVGKSFLNRNLVTYSTSELKKTIIGELPSVKEIKVVKKYPNSLEINITERTPAFIWETINKKYLVDEGGILTGEYEERFKDFPIVIDSKNIPVELGKQVVSRAFSTFLRDLSQSFNAYTAAKITRIEVPEITSEIKVTSDAGWYVLFDTTRTANNELLNLSRVLTEAKSKKKKLQYIDLRIDDRIFYK